jgi:metallo-beta-lactamase family protein
LSSETSVKKSANYSDFSAGILVTSENIGANRTADRRGAALTPPIDPDYRAGDAFERNPSRNHRMKLTFHGAAGEVTGSQHLIETEKLRVLLDCGLFQGRRAEARAKNERFRCEPKRLDGVILSHAHIDHCGNLPGLYKAGYRGPIFCTPATADIAKIMLADSAHIQLEDLRYLKRHLAPGHPPIEPLYDEEDAAATVKLFETLPYGAWHDLADDFRVRFAEAGHILGSAIVELEIRERGTWKRVVFTGDLGRRDIPLLRDPQLVDGCDVLITESTYGSRIHPAPSDLQAELLTILKTTVEKKGKVIIPAFSLGRTQTIVYFLNRLHNDGLLPPIQVFVDSPLSKELTAVHRYHTQEMDSELLGMMRSDPDPFSFPGLTYVSSQQESMNLNRRPGPFVIIAASGMCENGRVVHHLKHAVDDDRNTVAIIGFQAEYTLGRQLVERRPMVRIFDKLIPLRANVAVLQGLSAHADAEDFRWWFNNLSASGRGVGRAFIVHGEAEGANAVARLLDDICDEPPTIPKLHESFEV